MISLMHKELVQLRSQLLQVFGLLLAASVFLGKRVSPFVDSLSLSLPAVLSMTMPQMMFDQEERGNTFIFLRSLPVRPLEIVAAKYAVSGSTNLAAVILVGISQVWLGSGLEQVTVWMAGLVLVTFLLSALSLFLHFWLGTRAAKIALIVVAFGLSGSFLAFAQSGAGLGGAMERFVVSISPLAASAKGVALALLVGVVVLGVSLVASTAIFTRRDLSRIP